MGISGLLYIYDSFHHILVQNKNKTNILTANYRLGVRGHQEQSRRGADRQTERVRALCCVRNWISSESLSMDWALKSRERCGSDRFCLIYAAPHARCPFVSISLVVIAPRCFRPRPPSSPIHASGGIWYVLWLSLCPFPHKDDHQPAANPFIAATASWYTHQRGT